MSAKNSGNVARLARTGILAAGCFVLLGAPGRLMAQAGPGPMGPPPSDAQPESAPQPAAKPKPLPPPRATIAGAWKLNSDDSDNARDKIETAEGAGTDNTNPYPNRYPGGYPGSYPGGYPGQYPYPDNRPPQNTGPDIADNSKVAPLIQPPDSVTIDLVNAPAGAGSAVSATPNAGAPKPTHAPEVDLTDEDFNKLILVTDGRPLPKPADASRVEIAAHWDGDKLVSDEKSPLKGEMSRTFELSPDGRQLYETLHIDNGKKKPLVIRFVYDAVASDFQSDDSDPNRPTLHRGPDDSAP